MVVFFFALNKHGKNFFYICFFHGLIQISFVNVCLLPTQLCSYFSLPNFCWSQWIDIYFAILIYIFNWFLDSLPSRKYPWPVTFIERHWLIDNPRHYSILNPAIYFLLHFKYSVLIILHDNYCTSQITIHLIIILHNLQLLIPNATIHRV